LKKHLAAAHFIDATARALALGNSILVNIVMLGALGRLKVVPFNREDFKEAIAARLATGQHRKTETHIYWDFVSTSF